MPELKMRPLKAKDIFPMARILSKLKLKGKAKELLSGKTEDSFDAGFELVETIFGNLHLAQDEVNAFLADLVGMKPEDFSELEFGEFMDVLAQFKNQKGIMDFLKRAGL